MPNVPETSTPHDTPQATILAWYASHEHGRTSLRNAVDTWGLLPVMREVFHETIDTDSDTGDSFITEKGLAIVKRESGNCVAASDEPQDTDRVTFSFRRL